MTIRHVTKADLAYLIALYCACFAEPPWFEKFDPAELFREFEEILALEGNRIVGAVLGFAVSRKKDIVKSIPKSFRKGFYFSELFVDPNARRKGIAKLFLKELLSHAQINGFDCGVARTSVNQPIIQHLFLDEFGFRICATQETMSTKVIDGVEQESPDTRVIMVGSFPKQSYCEH